PGIWSLTVSARGYQRFEIANYSVATESAAKELIMPLRVGYTLRGRVYDEISGQGIVAASVGFRDADIAQFEGNWRNRVSVTTAKNGAFVLDGVPLGRITVEISAQDYAARELDVVVRDDTPLLEIGLSAGATISGRLTATDGVTPVTGAVGLFN